MSTVMVPASSDEALDMLESAMGFLAGVDPTSLPDAELARGLQVLERTDAVEAAVRGACWRFSTPGTATSATGSAPSGPGWYT
jgi:hypothetical protein